MRCKLSFLVLISTALAMMGCGGGGGGGSSYSPETVWQTGYCSMTAASSTLTYRTTWGASPQFSSQVIQVLSSTGSVVRSDSINRDTTIFSEINITQIPAGVYEVKVRLFSQANAGGVELATARAIVDLCAGGSGGVNRTVSTKFDETASSVNMFPSSARMIQQQSLRFVAHAKSSSGNAAFVDPEGFDWETLGGIGTVNEEGNFTADSAGTGQVKATLKNTALSAAAGIEVDEFIVEKKKWTILVFLNSANDLYSFSDLNVNQMEKVAGNPDVRFVVQWKQTRDVYPSSSFDGVRRYLVKEDQSPEIRSELVQNDLRDGTGKMLDMGNPQTLNDFVTWAKTYYPADRYALILWNHGNGWRRSREGAPTRAFSYDDQYGTSIKSWETDAALGGHDFDIIAWDSSLMQMMEVAYEVRAFTDFVVGSEESPPAEGYPYDAVFKEFRDNPDHSTVDLTQAFVSGMLNNPPYANRKITQSVIDSTKLDALAAALDTLADELIANDGSMDDAIHFARVNAQAYSQSGLRFYRDLHDLCDKLKSHNDTPASVKNACAAVQTAIGEAVVHEGHNSFSPGSKGVSIDFSPASVFASARADYIRLKLAQDTDWDEFLGLSP